MTTTEKTISMLNLLSEREMLDVQSYIQQIFVSRRKSKYALKPITKKEFLNNIDKSIEQSECGEVYTLEEVQERTLQKYGF